LEGNEKREKITRSPHKTELSKMQKCFNLPPVRKKGHRDIGRRDSKEVSVRGMFGKLAPDGRVAWREEIEKTDTRAREQKIERFEGIARNGARKERGTRAWERGAAGT